VDFSSLSVGGSCLKLPELSCCFRQRETQPPGLGLEFYEGAIRLPESSAPNTKNVSHTITADLNLTDADGVQGVILANRAITGGYMLYVNLDHHLVYEYNYFDTERTVLTSPDPLGDGKVEVKFTFVYDGNDACEAGIGCGGTANLYVNGEDTVDSKRIEKTVPARFGIETQDVGIDLMSPTSNDKDYDPPFEFTGGTIEKVTIELSPSSPEPDEEMGQQEFWDKIIQEVIR